MLNVSEKATRFNSERSFQIFCKYSKHRAVKNVSNIAKKMQILQAIAKYCKIFAGPFVSTKRAR